MTSLENYLGLVEVTLAEKLYRVTDYTLQDEYFWQLTVFLMGRPLYNITLFNWIFLYWFQIYRVSVREEVRRRLDWGKVAHFGVNKQ